MAEFNPKVQEVQPASYVGLSDGIRSSPNTALGNLFEGLAGVLDSGIKEQDRNIKKNIEGDIFDEVDHVQAEFGIPEATDLQSNAEEVSARTAPAGVERAGAQLQNLQNAYARGNLKESHYWARMNSMVRQLRGKYPGYRSEIDSMVSSVTGAKPANALRSALMQEWNDATQKTSARQKLIEKIAFDNTVGGLPSGYQDMTDEQLVDYASRKTAQAAQIDRTQKELSLQAAQGTLQEKDVEKNFRTDANQFVTTMLQDTTDSVGIGYQQIQEKIKEAQTAAGEGHPLEQTDVDQLRGMFSQLRANTRLALNKRGQASWDGKADHNYSSQLSREKYQAVVEQAMEPINIMEQALTSENPYGVLGMFSARLEAEKTTRGSEILKGMPILKELQAIREVAGDANMGLYMTAVPQVQTALVKGYLDYYNAKAANSLTNGSSVQDAFDKAEADDADQGVYEGIVKTWQNKVDMMAEGKFPEKLSADNVNWMFGPGTERVMASLNPSSQIEYYKKVASPVVTAQMVKLRNSGDEESWNKYSRWVSLGFKTLFRDRVKDMDALLQNPDLYSVSFDPKAARFDVKIVGAPMIGTFDTSAINLKAIRPLNDALQVIKPIIAEGKGDTGKELLKMLSDMGYNPDASREGGGSSLMKAVLDSLRANVSSSGGTNLLTPIGEL